MYAALRAGASDFLLKDTAPVDLLAAIRVIAAGEALLAPTVTRRLVDQFARRRPEPSIQPPEALIARETEVLVLIGRGLTNTEIAQQLFISPATAKGHVRHLLIKLDARDRVHLVILAYRAGLVRPTD